MAMKTKVTELIGSLEQFVQLPAGCCELWHQMYQLFNLTRPTMKKLPVIALALIGAATLAACGGRHYNEPVTVVATPTVVASSVYSYPSGMAIIPAPGMYVETVAVLRPGFGRVEARSPVMYTTGAPTGLTRLTLRMDDGSMQVVDSQGPSIGVGERVEITSERHIRYPLASR